MKKPRRWQIIYALFTLAYMGWMMHVGTNEFDRINSQYQRLSAPLDADLIRTAALEELVAECRRELLHRTDPEEDACTRWESPKVEARAKEVKERRVQARNRGGIKLILFYAGFAVLFLLGPPAFLYLLLAGLIALYRNIKIVR